MNGRINLFLACGCIARVRIVQAMFPHPNGFKSKPHQAVRIEQWHKSSHGFFSTVVRGRLRSRFEFSELRLSCMVEIFPINPSLFV
jgi:hypothetical protein